MASVVRSKNRDKGDFICLDIKLAETLIYPKVQQPALIELSSLASRSIIIANIYIYTRHTHTHTHSAIHVSHHTYAHTYTQMAVIVRSGDSNCLLRKLHLLQTFLRNTK